MSHSVLIRFILVHTRISIVLNYHKYIKYQWIEYPFQDEKHFLTRSNDADCRISLSVLTLKFHFYCSFAVVRTWPCLCMRTVRKKIPFMNKIYLNMTRFVLTKNSRFIHSLYSYAQKLCESTYFFILCFLFKLRIFLSLH